MDVGPAELLIVLAVVLLLFGSKKLPELARGWAKPPRSSARDFTMIPVTRARRTQIGAKRGSSARAPRRRLSPCLAHHRDGRVVEHVSRRVAPVVAWHGRTTTSARVYATAAPLLSDPTVHDAGATRRTQACLRRSCRGPVRAPGNTREMSRGHARPRLSIARTGHLMGGDGPGAMTANIETRDPSDQTNTSKRR